jgi:hypothetical protein
MPEKWQIFLGTDHHEYIYSKDWSASKENCFQASQAVLSLVSPSFHLDNPS